MPRRADYILPPARIRHAGGHLVFGTENQGGFDLLTDPTGDDPEVWYSVTPGQAVATHQPLSRFLLQFLLSEAALASPFDASVTVTAEQRLSTGTRDPVTLPDERFAAEENANGATTLAFERD